MERALARAARGRAARIRVAPGRVAHIRAVAGRVAHIRGGGPVLTRVVPRVLADIWVAGPVVVDTRAVELTANDERVVF